MIYMVKLINSKINKRPIPGHSGKGDYDQIGLTYNFFNHNLYFLTKGYIVEKKRYF